MAEKWCSDCCHPRPLEKFYRRYGGHQSICKDCAHARKRKGEVSFRKQGTPTVDLHVRIDPVLHSTLKALASRDGVTLSRKIQEILRAGMRSTT